MCAVTVRRSEAGVEGFGFAAFLPFVFESPFDSTRRPASAGKRT